MIHIRSALILLMLGALMFAAASLLTSVEDFWISSGFVVLCAIGYAVIGWLESRR